MGTADLGLFFRAEGAALAAFEHPAVAAATVRALAEDRDGALWVGTEGRGLTRFAGGEAVTWRAADGLAGDNVTSLWEDADGGLWIGTQAGLNRLARGAVVSVPELGGVEVPGGASPRSGGATPGCGRSSPSNAAPRATRSG